MSVYQALVNLVGDIPVGYEPVIYILAMVITIYLVVSAFSLIAGLFKLR